MNTTYRLGSIDNNNRRPLIDNTTDEIVASVVSVEGPATVGDLTLEQVQGNYGVLLGDNVSLIVDETEDTPAVYSVSLAGRPAMKVSGGHVSGHRQGSDDYRLALAAVREFTAPRFFA